MKNTNHINNWKSFRGLVFSALPKLVGSALKVCGGVDWFLPIIEVGLGCDKNDHTNERHFQAT